jgi:site-specific DNA recombinase
MLKAAIYARKSTDQSGVSDDQKSVARQIDQARAFAASKGWTVLDEHVYSDDGISGAEFQRRPDFMRLLNVLKPRAPFQHLIVSELSRLGREQFETGYACKQLAEAGVRIHSYLDTREIVLDSAIDGFMLSAGAFAAAIEREKAAQRMTDTMTRKARARHVTGGRVFGYRNIEVAGADGKRSHVERQIDDAEAAVVRRIFEMTVTGYGRKRIALALNAENAPAPRAQRGRPVAWCPSSITEALHRELYRGVIVWNRTRKRDKFGKHRQKPRAEAEWMRIDAPNLRIVPEGLWQAAHGILERRRALYLDRTGGKIYGRPVAGTVSPYLLTGFVACGCCEGGLIVRTQPHGLRREPRLACWHYQTRGPRVCRNRFEVSLASLDALVLDAVEDDLLNADTIDAVIREAIRQLAEADRAGADRSKDVARELAAIDRELDRLTSLAAQGASDIPAVLAALRARQERRRVLTAEAEAMARPARPGRSPRALEADLRARMEDWRGLLRRNAAEARPVLQTLLDGRIVVTPRTDATTPKRGTRGIAFDVQIPLTTRGLFEGVADCPKAVASPPGFEPGFQP